MPPLHWVGRCTAQVTHDVDDDGGIDDGDSAQHRQDDSDEERAADATLTTLGGILGFLLVSRAHDLWAFLLYFFISAFSLFGQNVVLLVNVAFTIDYFKQAHMRAQLLLVYSLRAEPSSSSLRAPPHGGYCAWRTERMVHLYCCVCARSTRVCVCVCVCVCVSECVEKAFFA